MGAVRSDRDHVGQRTDRNLAEDVRRGVVRVEEHHGAGLRLVLVFEGDDAEAVLADGDRVRDAGAGDLVDLLRFRRFRGVDDVDGGGLSVDGEDRVAVGGGDLGGGLIELTGLVGSEEVHLDLRIRGRGADGLVDFCSVRGTCFGRRTADGETGGQQECGRRGRERLRRQGVRHRVSGVERASRAELPTITYS